MLITFKSQTSPEVTMYQEHAQRILDVLNKNLTRGVITAAEAARAVELLEQEVALSKLHPEVDAEHASHTHAHHLLDEDETPEMAEKNHIGFAQRAYPFLEMLRAARDGGDNVMWGV
ncbi:uncharacterized protein DUF1840 [Pseudoduganella flava]|uniref:DUF1840 family protein n=1 Tax=Pseudoduganella flava TaxID=871742 RepID=A0A562Q2W2_9BURK|nr:DUF1840 domain-containing protein [Pseudoduganella flava]QGZ41096.1 DUF1840 family protein [Pseudoduganella flava]TWI51019.1 uncharacterized protein DUF1840 [Pseudoduganella flava]